MVDAVGILLCLQAEAAVADVGRAPLPCQRAVEKSAHVDLHTRLVGEHLDRPAALRIAKRRRGSQGSVRLPAANEVVVIHAAAGVGCRIRWQHLDRRPAPAPRSPLRPEVERRGLDQGEDTGRNRARIDRQVAIGDHGQLLVGDRSRGVARHVPVGVVDEVHDRGRIGRGRHLDDQFARGRERVDGLRHEPAGIPLIAVGRDEFELDRRSPVGRPRRSLPELLVESLHATVQVVDAIIGGERVGLAVELEPTGSNPIGAAAADRAEVGMPLQVAVERVEAEHDIDGVARRARLGRHQERGQDGTVVGDGRPPATRHLERVEMGLPAVGECSKGLHGGHGGGSGRGWILCREAGSGPQHDSAGSRATDR